jgi:helicase MOV-10
VNLKFSQEFIGRYKDHIELRFKDQQLKKEFIISRTARAIVGDRNAHEQLKARVPYVPRVRNRNREPETRIVEGEAPPSLNAIPYATRLPKAAIPAHLLSTLNASSRGTKENVDSIQNGFLPKILNSETHGRHFKNLIWVEEQQME